MGNDVFRHALEKHLEKDIDLFFEKWIKTTKLSYNSDKLVTAISHVPLHLKYNVIKSSLYWMNEPIGYEACLNISNAWLSMLAMKFWRFKNYAIVANLNDSGFANKNETFIQQKFLLT